jgi:hypothetical protein
VDTWIPEHLLKLNTLDIGGWLDDFFVGEWTLSSALSNVK